VEADAVSLGLPGLSGSRVWEAWLLPERVVTVDSTVHGENLSLSDDGSRTILTKAAFKYLERGLRSVPILRCRPSAKK
jgi:hypothetical protein